MRNIIFRTDEPEWVDIWMHGRNNHIFGVYQTDEIIFLDTELHSRARLWRTE